MLEQLIPLAVGALGGAGGGNLAGTLFRGASMGAAGNTITGLIGGALATYFLGPTWGPIAASIVGSGGLDAIVGNLVGGGVGGTVLTTVIGLIRSMMSK